MSRHIYNVGDTVVLKAGLTRTAAADRTCRIVSALPAAEYGDVQYRVRFRTENFERRIFEGDIDPSETALPVQIGKPVTVARGEPWLKPLSSRAAK